MLRAVFLAFLLLALLGDARIFLFILNRVVFGSHHTEKSPWSWLFYAVPPVLLVLTALFWPVNIWIERLMSTRMVERFTPDRLEDMAVSLALAKIGATWLIIAAAVGSYWILERIRILAFGIPPVGGVRDLPPEVIPLRRAHIPFAWIRRLGAHNDVYDIEVTKHEVLIDDLPEQFDGYRIAFMTDTHVASFMRRAFYREVVSQVHRFDPDIAIFGGDFVTFRRDITLMAELLGDVRARDGVFAILGNHDYWAGADLVQEQLGARGVQFIVNRSVMLARGGAKVPLIGIDEMYRGTPDPELAFRNLPPDGPCIGVSHHPDIIDLLGGRRLDLLVCGHTHGGQIRFPFFGAVVVPSMHEGEYAAGFHRVGRVLMYVSRGIGSIPPLRILCRPEVATFILKRGTRAHDREALTGVALD